MNQIDLNVRLQLINCCYSAMSANYAKDIKYGRKCIVQDRINISLLAVYLEILENYQIGIDTNCLTEEEIIVILDNISKLTGLCFQPFGYTYTT